MPLLARRRKRDRAGLVPWRVAEGRDHLYDICALPAVLEDDHQLRHPRSHLQHGLSPERQCLPPVPGGGYLYPQTESGMTGDLMRGMLRQSHREETELASNGTGGFSVGAVYDRAF